MLKVVAIDDGISVFHSIGGIVTRVGDDDESLGGHEMVVAPGVDLIDGGAGTIAASSHPLLGAWAEEEIAVELVGYIALPEGVTLGFLQANRRVVARRCWSNHHIDEAVEVGVNPSHLVAAGVEFQCSNVFGSIRHHHSL